MMTDISKEKSSHSFCDQLIISSFEVHFWDLSDACAYMPLVTFPFTFRQEEQKVMLWVLRNLKWYGVTVSPPRVCLAAKPAWVTQLRCAKCCPRCKTPL